MMNRKRSLKEEFRLYNAPRECATEAASVFLSRNQKWGNGQTPTVEEVERQLNIMRDEAIGKPGAVVRSGGLVYIAGYDEGMYGHIRWEWTSLYK